jgi:hypothetical protein
MNDTKPALMEHTELDVGSTVIVTGRPEVAVAVGVYVPPYVALFGAVDVKVIVWGALLTTVWFSISDVLPLKFGSPAYVAVSVFKPADVKTIVQLPAPFVRVLVQLCVPSDTVTSPTGVPLPGAITETL